MTAKPFFSVIIPTYNRASIIRTTIESVLNQEFQDFEIIVVDDGSSDETATLIKEITSSKILYHRKENGERGAARNTGVGFSKGQYITFLDSDDILYPNHLAVVHSTLIQMNLPEIYHQPYEVCFQDGRRKNYISDFGTSINEALLERGNILSCMGVFLKRDTAISIPFNEDRELSGVEDWELWIRVAARFPIYFDRTITSALIDHENRSVAKINKIELIRKMDLMFNYVYLDNVVKNRYAKFKEILKANIYSYISLQLSGHPTDKHITIKYLLMGLAKNPRAFFRRRTMAILRNLIFSW